MKPLWITPLIFLLPAGLAFGRSLQANKSRVSVGLIHFQRRYSIVSSKSMVLGGFRKLPISASEPTEGGNRRNP